MDCLGPTVVTHRSCHEYIPQNVSSTPERSIDYDCLIFFACSTTYLSADKVIHKKSMSFLEIVNAVVQILCNFSFEVISYKTKIHPSLNPSRQVHKALH